MTRIGLLSDTHGLLDKRVLEHFRDVDEIWHAGDIGSAEVLQRLREFKPTRAVFGNMDSGDVRYSLSEFYRFRVEEVNVLMTHIGGYPGKYNPWLIRWFEQSRQAKAKDDLRFTKDDLRLIIGAQRYYIFFDCANLVGKGWRISCIKYFTMAGNNIQVCVFLFVLFAHLKN